MIEVLDFATLTQDFIGVRNNVILIQNSTNHANKYISNTLD